MARPTPRQTNRAAFGVAGALAAALLGVSFATPARAQFNWFGLSDVSPQDVTDTIAEHGFRQIGPLYRTGRVYVADVVDRRNRRERLIVSADSGDIVQRFFVDAGPLERRPYFAERPRQPHDDSFFAHLQRGWDDEPPPRPPLSLPAPPGYDGDQVLVPRARQRSEPRVVTRTDIAPPTAAPLAPTPGPSGEPAGTKPDTAGGTPPSGAGRATTISNDPLRIPGTRKPDSPKPAPTAVATVKPPEPPVAKPAPLPVKPAPTPPKPADVPVAPLD